MLSDSDILEQLNDILANEESGDEFLDELYIDDDSGNFIYFFLSHSLCVQFYNCYYLFIFFTSIRQINRLRHLFHQVKMKINYLIVMNKVKYNF